MANISRNSFIESKNYDKVILQQGVPLTDYDFNEAQDIQRVKLRRVIKELLGDGAIGDGFKVEPTNPPSQAVLIKAGTIYVDGYRAVLNRDYILPVPAAPSSGTRTEYVYVEISEQEIDSVQDPDIKHYKLTIEPTRRIKIVTNFYVRQTVPTNTSTKVYYKLATLTRNAGDNVIKSQDIQDNRAVKATFTGEGFNVKGSVTLGDDENDTIDIQGRIKNTSSTFGGRVYIDDTLEVVGNLIVNSKITATGRIAQSGKYYEVARIPLFGVAGDIQYQSDSTTWEDVTPLLYWLFDFTNNRTMLPPVPSDATRKYRLRIAYSQTDGTKRASIRLITSDLSTTAITWNLPQFQGAITGERRYAESPDFTQLSSTAHWKIQAMITGGTFSISWIELVAYDIY